MDDQVVYAGRDLEAMSFAQNYHDWILEAFAPYLGTRIVEVGAGTGSFSEMILKYAPESLTLVEPSQAMYRVLVEKMKARLDTGVRIHSYNEVFGAVAAAIKSDQQPDSIIYVNVLEHIEDDLGELEIVHRTLTPEGRIFIFAPALQWLYGSFDRQVGHFRRYTSNELRNKCEQAGFSILKSTYFDSAGILPWWMKYRLFKSVKMEPGAVKFYDHIVIPPLKRLESLVEPPLGKNILLVAEKI